MTPLPPYEHLELRPERDIVWHDDGDECTGPDCLNPAHFERRFEWAGWLAHMGWPARLYWIVVVPRMRYDGLLYRVLAPVRSFGARHWVEAYKAWKAADYQPESWPR